MRPPLSCALALAALSLAACNGSHEGPAVRAFCPSFKDASTNAGGSLAVTDPAAAAADECVHRWAFALAPSRDEAGLAASAAVAACSAKLGAWNQAAISQLPSPSEGPPGGPPGAPAGLAPDILTGQPSTPMTAHNSFLHSRALLYVVEARAGRCAPPPMSKGAPSGI